MPKPKKPKASNLQEQIDREILDLLKCSKTAGIEYKDRVSTIALAVKWHATKEKLRDDEYGSAFGASSDQGDEDG